MSTLSNFYSTVNIWIHKPHVVHPKIFGAKVKNKDNNLLERLVIPKEKSHFKPFSERIERSGTEVFFTSEQITYVIRLQDFLISTAVLHTSGLGLLTVEWISNEFQRKLNEWLSQDLKPVIPTLCLIDVAEYQCMYNKLKNTYAKGIVQYWCERTDPLKFTYEDLGIAAYLICLWKGTEKKSIHFVDVGCGNGLLVSILINEGFNGVGVDIRKRKIWSSYPDSVQNRLLETTLDAEQCSGFPDATWLIGNHSDELTPWIPVLAARSGPDCKVFLLPCCPFSLFGKYNNFTHYPNEQESTSASASVEFQSRYRVYLKYLHGLFRVCGFEPESDVLRIPSTKRVCLVGRTFSPSSANYPSRMSSVEAAVYKEKLSVSATTCFVPRSYHEPVLNCTHVPRDITQLISHRIFTQLLRQPPNLDWLHSYQLVVSDSGQIQTLDGRWWNPGGSMDLKTVVSLIEPEHLELMKAQNGGLQTLLRNQHQTFQVTKGRVQLRWLPERMANIVHEEVNEVEPKLKKTTAKTMDKMKTRPCWMLQNHPDGCPYPSFLCDFAHFEEPGQ
ncbi:tRNA methyltransferase 44 [Clonorchis sinensis]|uniref:tRNA (uracil-O(2)-)-methyltransferase n=1 Tax=Clonorchis sinensis TaxID=79923 RepID=A0A419Q6H1_CLOSI|nr:tRNA methyltransferase 44 [Clonorchis sinensis]